MLTILPRWFPAVLVMLVIFAISSQPADRLPDFRDWDYSVKKMSHMLGYGLLASSYLHHFRYGRRSYWLAWIASVFYAATDEFHQSFIPGRSGSLLDVVVFDNIGATVALWCHSRCWRTNDQDLNPP